MRTAPWLAVLAAAGLVTAGAEAELTGIERGRVPGHHLLYLPNGKYLRVASLGYASVMADVLYLWSIQYYSNFQIEDRYKYVDHIYSGVITELDPHYFDPYWIGAMILSVEAGDLEKAVALLEKGFRNNPDRWIFLYLAGWECAYAKQFERAAGFFRTAAAVPSAPPDVGRLVAGMYQRAGDRTLALSEWSRIAESATDPGVKKIAEHRVRSLRIEADLETLRAGALAYHQRLGAWPERLEVLAREGLIRAVPLTPDGEPYDYDPRTGTVGSAAQRVLP